MHSCWAWLVFGSRAVAFVAWSHNNWLARFHLIVVSQCFTNELRIFDVDAIFTIIFEYTLLLFLCLSISFSYFCPAIFGIESKLAAVAHCCTHTAWICLVSPSHRRCSGALCVPKCTSCIFNGGRRFLSASARRMRTIGNRTTHHRGHFRLAFSFFCQIAYSTMLPNANKTWSEYFVLRAIHV